MSSSFIKNIYIFDISYHSSQFKEVKAKYEKGKISVPELKTLCADLLICLYKCLRWEDSV